MWPSVSFAKQPTHVFISSDTAGGPYGDYAPQSETREAGNLIRDVLGCGFERIEIISEPRATDGDLFTVRVRKDKWLEAAMPCLKQKLPSGFVIIDDRTMED